LAANVGYREDAAISFCFDLAGVSAPDNGRPMRISSQAPAPLAAFAPACNRYGCVTRLKDIRSNPHYFNLHERIFVCVCGAEESDYLEGPGDDAADGRVPSDDMTN
jgi:hypothetical protein